MQKIDEDKLFNLFSLYGNIVRIKILRNKPDHALVEMADGLQAELAVHYLKVRSISPSFLFSVAFLFCSHPFGMPMFFRVQFFLGRNWKLTTLSTPTSLPPLTLMTT